MNLVTVLGGYGVFGRRIAMALAQLPETRCPGRPVAAPSVGEPFARSISAEFRSCDFADDGHAPGCPRRLPGRRPRCRPVPGA